MNNNSDPGDKELWQCFITPDGTGGGGTFFRNCTVSFFTWIVGESPRLYRIPLCVDRWGVPTTGRILLYVDSRESPQMDRILQYVNSREVPTTGPYPSFCGQSGSPHNWTDMLSKSQSQQPDRKKVQLPQRGFSSEH